MSETQNGEFASSINFNLTLNCKCNVITTGG